MGEDAEAAPGSRRRKVQIAIAVVVAGVALGGIVAVRNDRDVTPRASPAAATTAAPGVTLVRSDPAAAARIPVTGATPQQLQTTRDVLASLGAEPGVASVTFDEKVSIKGTLGGIAIDTAYGNCTVAAAERWVDTLRAAGKLTGPWTTDK